MVEYKEFRVGDLFDVKSTKKTIHKNMLSSQDMVGPHPYITRTTQNNGLSGYIDYDEDYLNDANTISLGLDTYTLSYQAVPYFTGNKVKILHLKNKELNSRIAMYLISAYNKMFQGYEWGTGINQQAIVNMRLNLPATPSGTPDFDFMENYIKEIEQKHIKKLESDLATRTENLLTVIGREDLVGDPDGLAAVVDKGFDDSGVEYAEFHLNDLFTGDDITKGRRIKQSDREPGDIMLITAGMENYGVSGYIEEHIAHCDGDCMTIDMFGNVFYRPDEFFFDDNIVVYKNKRYDRYTYMYLVSALGHLVNRFGYGNQFRASKADDVVLTLPITEAGTPDFDFMAQYIAHIELKYTHTLTQWSKAKELL